MVVVTRIEHVLPLVIIVALLVLVVLRAACGPVPTWADLRGDVNGDGRADALDAMLILQESAGLDGIADAPHWWTLTVPDELVISRTGCTLEGRCLDYPAYFVPGDLPQVVVFRDTPWPLVMHEMCHAHQWLVAGGDEWLETYEALSFALAADDASNTLRRHPEVSPVEFYASMCARYYTGTQQLRNRAPVLYAWFEEHLRCSDC